MHLDSTQKLQAVSDAVATTTEPTFTVDYVDIETSNFGLSGLGTSAGALTGITTADILASPSSGRRKVNYISIENLDTVAHEITVYFYDGATAREQVTSTLQPGQTITWTDTAAWSNNLDLLSLFDNANTWNGANTFLGDVIVGDPGLEAAGITVAATTYNSSLKVSELGGTDIAQFIIHRHSTTLPAIIVGSRAHSDTSAHAIVQDTDGLLTIYGVGWDGVDYAIGASISMTVDGTPGAGAMPTRIDLATSPSGTETPVVALSINPDGTVTTTAGLGVGTSTIYGIATLYPGSGADCNFTMLTDDTHTAQILFRDSTAVAAKILYNHSDDHMAFVGSGLTEAMRIDSNAVLVLTNGQLQFPATQNPSTDANTLDDYEEGTWTPVFTSSGTPPTGVTYSTQYGKYTKIGNKVTAYMRATLTSKGTGGTGNVQFTGLPFANGASQTAIEDGYVNITSAFPAGTSYPYYAVISAGTTLLLGFSGSAAASGSLTWANAANTDDFLVTLTYFT